MNGYLGIKIGPSSRMDSTYHTADKVQKWYKNNLKFFIRKEKWSPNSSELNPLDYSIWDNNLKSCRISSSQNNQ